MGSQEEPEQQESGKGADGACESMADATPAANGSGTSGEADDAPAWANSLKQLYSDVVDEPLPGSFKDLLDQFDETGEDGEPSDPEIPA